MEQREKGKGLQDIVEYFWRFLVDLYFHFATQMATEMALEQEEQSKIGFAFI